MRLGRFLQIGAGGNQPPKKHSVQIKWRQPIPTLLIASSDAQHYIVYRKFCLIDPIDLSRESVGLAVKVHVRRSA